MFFFAHKKFSCVLGSVCLALLICFSSASNASTTPTLPLNTERFVCNPARLDGQHWFYISGVLGILSDIGGPRRYLYQVEIKYSSDSNGPSPNDVLIYRGYPVDVPYDLAIRRLAGNNYEVGYGIPSIDGSSGLWGIVYIRRYGYYISVDNDRLICGNPDLPRI